MRELNISVARTHFSALVRSVEQNGEPILIRRNGRVVAELAPIDPATDSESHPDPGSPAGE